jgi:hypothetical protein
MKVKHFKHPSHFGLHATSLEPNREILAILKKNPNWLTLARKKKKTK